VKIQSATTATRPVTSHVTARASVAPDLDLEAAATTAEIATVEATDEGTIRDLDLSHAVAAITRAETTTAAGTQDPTPATATTTMVGIDTTAAAAAPADPEAPAATGTIAGKTLPLRREASQATGEALLSKPATPKSETHECFY
jgi:hypothetical protein